MTRNTSKTEFIALFALLTAMTAFGTDAILPALPAIAETYGSSDGVDGSCITRRRNAP